MMLIDAHRHFVANKSNFNNMLADMIAEMDFDGISKSLIFGQNGRINLSGSDDYFIEKAYLEYPNRLIPILSDIDFSNTNCVSYVEKKLSTGIFYGIGEVLIFRFDNISFLDSHVIDVFNLLSTFNLPAICHVRVNQFDDFEKLLNICKSTNFILCHAGYDFENIRTNPLDVKHITRLLTTFDNLYCDISTYTRSPLCFANDQWINLINKYNNRFVFGTDMTGPYMKQSTWLTDYNKLFKLLNTDTVKKLSSENITRLCSIKNSYK